MTVNYPVGEQGSGVQNKSGSHRPFGHTLNRATFVNERQDGMNRGYQISRQDCQE